eukprot:m.223226 g.223226  ORF g.223226 m.223226 type:complete len:513 (+) comp15138_c0_seq1:541-2079(+)
MFVQTRMNVDSSHVACKRMHAGRGSQSHESVAVLAETAAAFLDKLTTFSFNLQKNLFVWLSPLPYNNNNIITMSSLELMGFGDASTDVDAVQYDLGGKGGTARIPPRRPPKTRGVPTFPTAQESLYVSMDTDGRPYIDPKPLDRNLPVQDQMRQLEDVVSSLAGILQQQQNLVKQSQPFPGMPSSTAIGKSNFTRFWKILCVLALILSVGSLILAGVTQGTTSSSTSATGGTSASSSSSASLIALQARVQILNLTLAHQTTQMAATVATVSRLQSRIGVLEAATGTPSPPPPPPVPSPSPSPAPSPSPSASPAGASYVTVENESLLLSAPNGVYISHNVTHKLQENLAQGWDRTSLCVAVGDYIEFSWTSTASVLEVTSDGNVVAGGWNSGPATAGGVYTIRITAIGEHYVATSSVGKNVHITTDCQSGVGQSLLLPVTGYAQVRLKSSGSNDYNDCYDAHGTMRLPPTYSPITYNQCKCSSGTLACMSPYSNSGSRYSNTQLQLCFCLGGV